MTPRYNSGPKGERQCGFNSSKCNTELSSIRSTHLGAYNGVKATRRVQELGKEGAKYQKINNCNIQMQLYYLLMWGAEICELALMGLVCWGVQ